MSEKQGRAALEKRTPVFACGGVCYSDGDVIDAALFHGELQPIWCELLRTIECENQAGDEEIEEGALDQAAEEFRYNHDLITAEETEHWLEARGLTVDDFGEYFARRYWGENCEEEIEPASLDYAAAREDLRELLRIDLVLSGAFDKLAVELSWRVAANFAASGEGVDPALIAAEEKTFFERSGIDQSKLSGWLDGIGRDRDWLDSMLRTEAVFQRTRDQLLTPQARKSELNALRLPLTRFEVEVIEVESQDAAREAALCVTSDGLSMEEVAQEGRYGFRRLELLLQDIDNGLQQKFLSVSPGKILDPLPRGEGFQLCRIMKKIEPDVSDPALHARIDQSILERHFSQLAANHIQWQGAFSFAQ